MQLKEQQLPIGQGEAQLIVGPSGGVLEGMILEVGLGSTRLSNGR